MKPQNKAILAAGEGCVFIRTDDGNAVSLTTDTAKMIVNNLPDIIQIAERLEVQKLCANTCIQ